MKETAAELALRKGEVPESVKNLGKGGQRKTRKKAGSDRMAEGDDNYRVAEDDDASAYADALKEKLVVYVVEGEEMKLERQGRRTGGASYRTAACHSRRRRRWQ